ncbi:YHS domain-containing protein [Halomonas sp. NPDC076908]|jgi:YHS domain-containing protein|uniref:YHS domain-containing protein n=1 Tax=Halomonas sp. NPDC076908 TaxID=3390567 RepID=UPI003CFF908F
MDALFYFLLWAAILFLMMRFGCGAHVMGHRHGRSNHGDDSREDPHATEGLKWIPPAEDVDPVCGKTVRTERAKPSVHDGHVFYFCSRDCRERFEAAPEQYLVPGATASPLQPENKDA